MKKFIRVILFLILASACILTAAGNDNRVFRVGFVPKAFISVHFITMAESMLKAAETYPHISVKIASPIDQTDIKGQIDIIENIIRENIDLLAISVNHNRAITPSLKRAQAAGIKIIILDTCTSLPDIDVLSLMGSNDAGGGEVIGWAVARLLNGKGKVAVLEGIKEQKENEMRLRGFYKALHDYPDITVAVTEHANGQRDLAVSVMDSILLAHPDINLVWAVNDNMAIGALEAIRDSGKADQIHVLGYNGDPEALVSIAAGELYASILEQPDKIGQTVIEVAEMLRTGNNHSILPVYQFPIMLVTQDNVKQYLNPIE